jgi:hypothetical protein
VRRSEAWLLIASLLVALGLYLQVQPGDKIEREREFSVPLQVVGLEPKFAAREVPSSVLLLATGTEEEQMAVFRRVRDEIRRVFEAYAAGLLDAQGR